MLEHAGWEELQVIVQIGSSSLSPISNWAARRIFRSAVRGYPCRWDFSALTTFAAKKFLPPLIGLHLLAFIACIAHNGCMQHIRNVPDSSSIDAGVTLAS